MSVSCRIHAFKRKEAGEKCVWCGRLYEALDKAKEVDPRQLRFDEPELKKRKRPTQSDTNWRDVRNVTRLTSFDWKELSKDICPFCEKRKKAFGKRHKNGYIERLNLCLKCASK